MNIEDLLNSSTFHNAKAKALDGQGSANAYNCAVNALVADAMLLGALAVAGVPSPNAEKCIAESRERLQRVVGLQCDLAEAGE